MAQTTKQNSDVVSASKLIEYKEISSPLNRSIIMLMDRYIGGSEHSDERAALQEELNNLTTPARKALLKLLIGVRTASEKWGQENPLPSLNKLLLDDKIRKLPRGKSPGGRPKCVPKKK